MMTGLSHLLSMQNDLGSRVWRLLEQYLVCYELELTIFPPRCFYSLCLLTIFLLLRNLELFDYPSSHQLLIYTTSSDAPAYASRALEDLSVDSLDLEQAIYKISDKLQKALAPDNDGFEDYEDFEDLEGSDSDEGSVGGWSDDELQIDVDGDSQMVDGSGPEAPERKARRHALIKELRNDLRRAKTAGFKVGVLGDWRGGINFYVALGVRVGKLGISEEATNAWKLDRTKYFIVLIHYSNYYQTLERLTGEIAGYHAKKGVALCVGTSSRYKPTLQEAINSFSRFSSGAENPGQHVIGTTDGLETELDASRKQEWDFEGIFISGPLNQLLNSTLVPLLKYRLRFGFPWEGAELYYSSKPLTKSSGGSPELI
jgi:ubiquitin-conjugating enzyme E2 Q